uniref:Uncharacterized protein n=1 Tax=Rhizophora mucronata TaxID=61149 RepID=A0A2P2QR99_RHIMU
MSLRAELVFGKTSKLWCDCILLNYLVLRSHPISSCPGFNKFCQRVYVCNISIII